MVNQDILRSVIFIRSGIKQNMPYTRERDSTERTRLMFVTASKVQLVRNVLNHSVLSLRNEMIRAHIVVVNALVDVNTKFESQGIAVFVKPPFFGV